MVLTLHTGFMGEETVIYLDWYDENNVPCKDELIIKIKDADKPREMEIILNNVKIAEMKAKRQ